MLKLYAYMNRRHLFIFLLICAGSTGCAGPMSPFGAIEQGRWPSSHEPLDMNSNFMPDDVKATFSPSKQLYHKSFDIKLSVEDAQGIQELENLQLHYKGQRIDQLLNTPLKWKMSEDNTKAELSLPQVKLPPHIQHELILSYKKEGVTYHVRQDPPTCNMTESHKLQNIENFKEHEHLLKILELMAMKQKISPSFMAALTVEQARHNFITDHEWRFDTEKSIDESIDYINSLKEFWQQNKTSNEGLTDLVLASFLTSPYIVQRAVNESGNGWKQASEVKAILPKMRELKSYCYEFSTASL